MTIKQFILQSLNSGDMDKINWYYTVLAYMGDGPSEYLTFKEGKAYAKHFDNEIIEGFKKAPLLNINDVFTFNKGDLANIFKDEVVTTFGIFLLNHVHLANVFGDKIAFVNGGFSIGGLSNKEIPAMLLSKEITTDNLLDFVNTVTFNEKLADIIVQSVGPKTYYAPPNIKAERKRIINELTEEYGPDWKTKLPYIAEYDKRLKEVDKKYYEDDPTSGVLLSGKITNQARKKTKLSVGGLVNEFDPTKPPVFIEESLAEGIPLDPEKIVAMNNESRAGSYSRGKETQFGGVTAEMINRALASLMLTDDPDCGTKVGAPTNITKSNFNLYKQRYKIVNGKPVDITKEDIGKTVILRSPRYCIARQHRRCPTCMGKVMGKKKNGFNILGMHISDVIIIINMKKMHGGTIEAVEIDLMEALH